MEAEVISKPKLNADYSLFGKLNKLYQIYIEYSPLVIHNEIHFMCGLKRQLSLQA
jgi:hypothetical protein